MSNILNVANRTMKSANETISNFRNQMSETGAKFKENISDTGTKLINDVKRKIKGGPLTAPKSEVIMELDPEINDGISKIQATSRRTRNVKTVGNMTRRWDNEMTQNETNRGAANKLTSALKRKQQQTEY